MWPPHLIVNLIHESLECQFTNISNDLTPYSDFPYLRILLSSFLTSLVTMSRMDLGGAIMMNTMARRHPAAIFSRCRPQSRLKRMFVMLLLFGHIKSARQSFIRIYSQMNESTHKMKRKYMNPQSHAKLMSKRYTQHYKWVSFPESVTRIWTCWQAFHEHGIF